MAMGSTARKRILVVGGGFGGIATVRVLHKALHGRTDIEIALVNQENYAVFQPMLVEVISGNISPLNTVTPIRDLCPGAPSTCAPWSVLIWTTKSSSPAMG